MSNNLEIAIGEKIKSFRKKREITQEQLADYLKISFQSVSKWECGDAYPDIAMLPKIAMFFGVTTDELLCIDKLKEQEEIDEYIKRRYNAHSIGRNDEAVAVMREANAKYPGNFKLMLELAEVIQIAACAKADKNAFEEVLSIGEKIRAECKDDNVRRDVLKVMCYSHYWLKENKKAIKLINENLGSVNLSREKMLEQVLEGEELINQHQQNLVIFMDFALSNMKRLSDNFAPKDKIEVYENIIKILSMIFTDGDYGTYHMTLSDLHIDLAKINLDLANNDKALEHLKTAADFTIVFDNLSTPSPHTSPLINRTVTGIILKNYTQNQSYCMLNGSLISSGLNDEKYNAIRNTPEFIEICEELKKHAK